MTDPLDALQAGLVDLEASLHRLRSAVYDAVDDVTAESGDAEDEVLVLQRVLRRRHRREVESILEEFNNIDVAVAGAREALWDLDPAVLLAPLHELVAEIRAGTGVRPGRQDPTDGP